MGVYPSWRYHREKGGRIVHSESEEKGLGPGWTKRADILTDKSRALVLEQEAAYRKAAEPKERHKTEKPKPVDPELEPKESSDPDLQPGEHEDAPLETMTAEELHAIAKERGVKVHHKSGKKKVIEALLEAEDAE